MYTADVHDSLFQNYITYNSLYALNSFVFYGKTDADKVNIFIDLNSFTRNLFSSSQNIQYSYKDSLTPIAASAINFVAHLRQYYLTRHKTYAKFYLVWGENTLPMCFGYNAHYIQAFNSKTTMKEMLYRNLEILKQICPYIPDLYYIDGGVHEVGAIISTLIANPQLSHTFHGFPNIIYSKDTYCYQVVAYYPKTCMFRPKKVYIGTNSDENDKSWPVTKSTIYNAFRHAYKYVNRGDDHPTNATFFPIVIALCGLKERHVDGLMSFNAACHTIRAAEDKGIIHPDMHIEVIEDIMAHANEYPVFRCKRFHGMSSIHQIVSSEEARKRIELEPNFLSLFQGIVDLVAPEDIKEINNKYFVHYPLDLMHL